MHRYSAESMAKFCSNVMLPLNSGPPTSIRERIIAARLTKGLAGRIPLLILSSIASYALMTLISFFLDGRHPLTTASFFLCALIVLTTSGLLWLHFEPHLLQMLWSRARCMYAPNRP